jgi:adenylyltransferase/sulfurtransferase
VAPVPEIEPVELKRRIDAGERPYVLDVREPWEFAISSLAGSTNIPLNEIPLRLKELDADSDIIVMCKAGGRSRSAAAFLLARGFKKVGNLHGGIDAWACDIDPGLPTY